MIQSMPFVMPLDSALEQLQQEAFSCFLLTIEYNTVSIFTDSNGLLKVFDSHARDSFGMPHPHGTCVLLEFDSIRNLTEYFKQFYRPGVVFEIKGVKINCICRELLQNKNTSNDVMPRSNANLLCSTSTVADETMNDNSIFNEMQCQYIFLYAICFSTVKTCNYWNDQMQTAIVENAIKLFGEIRSENRLSSTHMPESIDICGSTVDITYTARHEGTLCCTSVSSKVALEKLIFANTTCIPHNTGFLIGFENDDVIACIIQNKMHVKKQNQRAKYFLLVFNETCQLNLSKELPDSRSVVDTLCDYFYEPGLNETATMIMFFNFCQIHPY